MRYHTFNDILKADRFSDHGYATCRFCHEYGKETTYYAVRHVVCRDCCAKRGAEVLPSVLKAEAKARAAVKRLDITDAGNIRFIAYLSGASEDYVRSLIEKRP